MLGTAFGTRSPAALTFSYEDRDEVTSGEVSHLFDHARCPDCRGDLLRGPEGGNALNVYCANRDRCGSGFNLLRGLGIAERITPRQPARAR